MRGCAVCTIADVLKPSAHSTVHFIDDLRRDIFPRDQLNSVFECYNLGARRMQGFLAVEFLDASQECENIIRTDLSIFRQTFRLQHLPKTALNMLDSILRHFELTKSVHGLPEGNTTSIVLVDSHHDHLLRRGIARVVSTLNRLNKLIDELCGDLSPRNNIDRGLEAIDLSATFVCAERAVSKAKALHDIEDVVSWHLLAGVLAFRHGD